MTYLGKNGTQRLFYPHIIGQIEVQYTHENVLTKHGQFGPGLLNIRTSRDGTHQLLNPDYGTI